MFKRVNKISSNIFKNFSPLRFISPFCAEDNNSDKLGTGVFWINWVIIVITLSIIHLASVDVAPFLHSDEFLILDLGRIILHPDTQWSIAWLTGNDQPVFVWFYLGPVLQELVFQVVGQYGPRIFALLGAIVAATVLVGWLLSKNTWRHAAFVLGLIFLLDPIFVQSYSLGRVDSWTMALCLGACWILQCTASESVKKWSRKRNIIIAGAFMTTALFIWPSAIFLLPLVLIELSNLVNKDDPKKLRKFIRAIFFFGIGSLVTAILLVMPILSQLLNQFDNVLNGISTNTRSGPSGARHFAYSFDQFQELFRVLKFTPFLFLLAIIAAVIKRKTTLVYAGILVVLLMTITVVYIQRVQYLLPYLILSIAGIYQFNKQQSYKPITRKLKIGGLIMVLSWCVTLSLIARTVLAFDKPEERKRMLVFQAAKTLIGSGEYAVFMPNEFYYAARELGWKMYKPYLAQNEPITPEILQQILPHVNYVIGGAPSKEATKINQVLEKAGMRFQKSFFIYEKRANTEQGRAPNLLRLRNLYSIHRQPYGPYYLYARKNDKRIAVK